MLTLGVITPSLGDIRSDLDTSYAAVSWAISIFAVGRLVANIPVARLAARPSARVPLLVGGTACVAGGTLLSVVRPDLGLLLAGRAIAGIGSSAVTTAGTLVVLEGSDVGERGAASGRFSAALGAGAMTGPALGGVLAAVVGWRGAMAVTGLVLAGFAVVLLMTATNRVAGPVDDGGQTSDPPMSGSGKRTAVLVAVLLQPAAVAAYATTFAVFWARGAIQQTILPLRGTDVLGMSSLQLAVLLFACSATATAGTALAGRVLDARGWPRVVPVQLLVLVAGCAVVAVAPSIALLVAGTLVTAVGLSSGGAPPSMVVDAVPPALRARAIGWTRMIGDVALLAGPALTGWLADGVGFTAGSVLAAAVTAVTFCGVALLARRTSVATSVLPPSRARGTDSQVEVGRRDPEEAQRDRPIASDEGAGLDEHDEVARVQAEVRS